MKLHSIGIWISQYPGKTSLFTLLILIFIWLLVCTILLLISPKLFYNTKASYNVTPDIVYEQLWLNDQYDRIIDTIWIPNKKAEKVVLYLHGNRGRLSHFFPPLSEKYHVLAPAYPGYHESTGKPSTKSIYNTALLAYDYLIKQGYTPEQIILFGHSMGGSPAVYTATKRPDAGKLVIVNTFYSMFDMCWPKCNIFCIFSKSILNTADYAPDVKTKVRQYHFINDDVVPYRQGVKLFTRFTGTQDKKFVTMNGHLTHSDFDILELIENN